jgi:O-antigen ligase
LAWLGLAFSLPIASGIRIGPASTTDLLLAASLALWFASFVTRTRQPYVPHPPLWPVALYILVLYLSSLGALNLAEALTEMVKWIEFAAILLLVPSALPPKMVPWLVGALLAAAALQGVYGLYQFVFRIGPEWFLIQGRFMRAGGVFGQPNPFGAYLGLSLPVAASLALWSLTALLSRWSLSRLAWALFYILAACAISAGLVASWSRGAWLGAAGALIVVLAFYNRRTALLLGLALLVLATTALLGALNPAWIPAAIAGRIGGIPAYLGFVNVLTLDVNDDNFAVIERVAHWVAALRMWEIAPWLGVGPGNYASAYAEVALPRWSDPLGHAHNIYLNVLGESGLLGLGAFLLMWSLLVGWLSQQLSLLLPSQSWSRALAVGVLGVLAHLAIHSFFDNLFVQGIYLHIAFWFAAVATSRVAPGPQPGSKELSSLTAFPVESDG